MIDGRSAVSLSFNKELLNCLCILTLLTACTEWIRHFEPFFSVCENLKGGPHGSQFFFFLLKLCLFVCFVTIDMHSCVPASMKFSDLQQLTAYRKEAERQGFFFGRVPEKTASWGNLRNVDTITTQKCMQWYTHM